MNTKKVSAAALSGLVFLTNCAFAYAVESNVWDERKESAAIQMASLPTNASPLNIFPTQLNSLLKQQLGKQNALNRSAQMAAIVRAVPSNFGTIRSIRIPAGKSNGKTLIHIQDVHLNFEAQKNISNTISSLSARLPVDVLAVEGAFNEIPTAPFRLAAHRPTVKKVADTLLNQNKIAGPLHFSLTQTTTHPALMGIDDSIAYHSNVEAYLQSRSTIEKTKKRINQTRAAFDNQKSISLNPQLRSFDAHVSAYRQEKTSLGDYLAVLSSLSTRASHNIEIFLEASDLETKMNLTAVQKERSQFLEKLSSSLSNRETDALLDRSVQFKLNRISTGEFYGFLKDLGKTKGMDLRSFPHLNAYIQYVLLSDSIDLEGLTAEIKTQEEKIYAHLIKNEAERNLVQSSARAELASRLIDFALSPDEWKEYKSLRDENNPLSASLRPFEKFYEEAEIRDHSMAVNTSKEMETRNASLGIIVTGGFHSRGMADRLSKEGYTVLSFVPRITEIDTEKGSAYLTAFAQEKSPLDQIFAGEKLFLANQSGTPGQMADTALRVVQAELNAGTIVPSQANPTFKQLLPWLAGGTIKTIKTRLGFILQFITPKGKGVGLNEHGLLFKLAIPLTAMTLLTSFSASAMDLASEITLRNLIQSSLTNRYFIILVLIVGTGILIDVMRESKYLVRENKMLRDVQTGDEYPERVGSNTLSAFSTGLTLLVMMFFPIDLTWSRVLILYGSYKISYFVFTALHDGSHLLADGQATLEHPLDFLRKAYKALHIRNFIPEFLAGSDILKGYVVVESRLRPQIIAAAAAPQKLHLGVAFTALVSGLVVLPFFVDSSWVYFVLIPIFFSNIVIYVRSKTDRIASKTGLLPADKKMWAHNPSPVESIHPVSIEEITVPFATQKMKFAGELKDEILIRLGELHTLVPLPASDLSAALEIFFYDVLSSLPSDSKFDIHLSQVEQEIQIHAAFAPDEDLQQLPNLRATNEAIQKMGPVFVHQNKSGATLTLPTQPLINEQPALEDGPLLRERLRHLLREHPTSYGVKLKWIRGILEETLSRPDKLSTGNLLSYLWVNDAEIFKIAAAILAKRLEDKNTDPVAEQLRSNHMGQFKAALLKMIHAGEQSREIQQIAFWYLIRMPEGFNEAQNLGALYEERMTESPAFPDELKLLGTEWFTQQAPRLRNTKEFNGKWIHDKNRDFSIRVEQKPEFTKVFIDSPRWFDLGPGRLSTFIVWSLKFLGLWNRLEKRSKNTVATLIFKPGNPKEIPANGTLDFEHLLLQTLMVDVEIETTPESETTNIVQMIFEEWAARVAPHHTMLTISKNDVEKSHLKFENTMFRQIKSNRHKDLFTYWANPVKQSWSVRYMNGPLYENSKKILVIVIAVVGTIIPVIPCYVIILLWGRLFSYFDEAMHIFAAWKYQTPLKRPLKGLKFFAHIMLGGEAHLELDDSVKESDGYKTIVFPTHAWKFIFHGFLVVSLLAGTITSRGIIPLGWGIPLTSILAVIGLTAGLMSHQAHKKGQDLSNVQEAILGHSGVKAMHSPLNPNIFAEALADLLEWLVKFEKNIRVKIEPLQPALSETPSSTVAKTLARAIVDEEAKRKGLRGVKIMRSPLNALTNALSPRGLLDRFGRRQSSSKNEQTPSSQSNVLPQARRAVKMVPPPSGPPTGMGLAVNPVPENPNNNSFSTGAVFEPIFSFLRIFNLINGSSPQGSDYSNSENSPTPSQNIFTQLFAQTFVPSLAGIGSGRRYALNKNGLPKDALGFDGIENQFGIIAFFSLALATLLIYPVHSGITQLPGVEQISALTLYFSISVLALTAILAYQTARHGKDLTIEFKSIFPKILSAFNFGSSSIAHQTFAHNKTEAIENEKQAAPEFKFLAAVVADDSTLQSAVAQIFTTDTHGDSTSPASAALSQTNSQAIETRTQHLRESILTQINQSANSVSLLQTPLEQVTAIIEKDRNSSFTTAEIMALIRMGQALQVARGQLPELSQDANEFRAQPNQDDVVLGKYSFIEIKAAALIIRDRLIRETSANRSPNSREEAQRKILGRLLSDSNIFKSVLLQLRKEAALKSQSRKTRGADAQNQKGRKNPGNIQKSSLPAGTPRDADVLLRTSQAIVIISEQTGQSPVDLLNLLKDSQKLNPAQTQLTESILTLVGLPVNVDINNLSLSVDLSLVQEAVSQIQKSAEFLYQRWAASASLADRAVHFSLQDLFSSPLFSERLTGYGAIALALAGGAFELGGMRNVTLGLWGASTTMMIAHVYIRRGFKAWLAKAQTTSTGYQPQNEKPRKPANPTISELNHLAEVIVQNAERVADFKTWGVEKQPGAGQTIESILGKPEILGINQKQALQYISHKTLNDRDISTLINLIQEKMRDRVEAGDLTLPEARKIVQSLARRGLSAEKMTQLIPGKDVIYALHIQNQPGASSLDEIEKKLSREVLPLLPKSNSSDLILVVDIAYYDQVLPLIKKYGNVILIGTRGKPLFNEKDNVLQLNLMVVEIGLMSLFRDAELKKPDTLAHSLSNMVMVIPQDVTVDTTHMGQLTLLDRTSFIFLQDLLSGGEIHRANLVNLEAIAQLLATGA